MVHNIDALKKHAIMSEIKLGRIKKRRYNVIFKKKGKQSARLMFLPSKVAIKRFLRANKKKLILQLIFIAFLTIGAQTTFLKVDKQVDRFRAEAYAKNYSDITSELPSNSTEAKSFTTFFTDPKENLSVEFKTTDKRAFVLNEYFKAKNSPLVGKGQVFVDACDKYGAPKDCISVVAIAKHETDLCKYYNSAEMFNCWGWGGGGGYRMRFSSFEESVDVVTRVLVTQYGANYMRDPSLMEKVFCGPQDECIGWGNRVKIIMREIDKFSEDLGVGRLTELDK